MWIYKKLFFIEIIRVTYEKSQSSIRNLIRKYNEKLWNFKNKSRKKKTKKFLFTNFIVLSHA